MKPGVSEQFLNQQQQYGAKDPYMSYLNQADTGITTLRLSKPGKFKTDFGSQTSDGMVQSTYAPDAASTR